MKHPTEVLNLTGNDLSLDDVVRLARNPLMRVEFDDGKWDLLQKSFDFVMMAAAKGTPIYGLTTGVGWNKDKVVFKDYNSGDGPSDELLERSREFNLALLRSHSAGLGKPLSIEIVRAGMLIRLNQFLKGESGVQPEVARIYLEFLNRGITPVVPSKGSVGAADIALSAHIGLAMIGEGSVYYKGKRVQAMQAINNAGLQPLKPIGKDFLSIISTNAITAGHAVILAYDVRKYLDKQTAVFGLTLEGFNGNVTPFLRQSTCARPYPEMLQGASAICSVLEGSYLHYPDPNRALQDPLSYRTMAFSLGNAMAALDSLDEALHLHINHCDDNPSVQFGSPRKSTDEATLNYVVDDEIQGGIYPTANFDMLPISSRVEHLNRALLRLAQAICLQTILFENPAMTGLSRFLNAEDNSGHGFGALQKLLSSLYTETVHLGGHAPQDSFTMAGNIEDISGNAPLSVHNLKRILENMYWISSVQLLHAAQAIDLRKPSQLGKKTQALFDAYRRQVPFVVHDRAFTEDFQNGYHFISGKPFGDEAIPM